VSRAELAESALKISQEMLRATESDAWEDLPALDEERERVIADLFDGLDPGDPENAIWERMLWEVQRLNDEVLNRVLAERDLVGQELARFRKVRKAGQVYAQQSLHAVE
jgi:hypothetical protein